MSEKSPGRLRSGLSKLVGDSKPGQLSIGLFGKHPSDSEHFEEIGRSGALAELCSTIRAGFRTAIASRRLVGARHRQAGGHAISHTFFGELRSQRYLLCLALRDSRDSHGRDEYPLVAIASGTGYGHRSASEILTELEALLDAVTGLTTLNAVRAEVARRRDRFTLPTEPTGSTSPSSSQYAFDLALTSLAASTVYQDDPIPLLRAAHLMSSGVAGFWPADDGKSRPRTHGSAAHSAQSTAHFRLRRAEKWYELLTSVAPPDVFTAQLSGGNATHIDLLAGDIAEFDWSIMTAPVDRLPLLELADTAIPRDALAILAAKVGVDLPPAPVEAPPPAASPPNVTSPDTVPQVAKQPDPVPQAEAPPTPTPAPSSPPPAHVAATAPLSEPTSDASSDARPPGDPAPPSDPAPRSDVASRTQDKPAAVRDAVVVPPEPAASPTPPLVSPPVQTPDTQPPKSVEAESVPPHKADPPPVIQEPVPAPVTVAVAPPKVDVPPVSVTADALSVPDSPAVAKESAPTLPPHSEPLQPAPSTASPADTTGGSSPAPAVAPTAPPPPTANSGLPKWLAPVAAGLVVVGLTSLVLLNRPTGTTVAGNHSGGATTTPANPSTPSSSQSATPPEPPHSIQKLPAEATPPQLPPNQPQVLSPPPPSPASRPNPAADKPPHAADHLSPTTEPGPAVYANKPTIPPVPTQPPEVTSRGVPPVRTLTMDEYVQQARGAADAIKGAPQFYEAIKLRIARLSEKTGDAAGVGRRMALDVEELKKQVGLQLYLVSTGGEGPDETLLRSRILAQLAASIASPDQPISELASLQRGLIESAKVVREAADESRSALTRGYLPSEEPGSGRASALATRDGLTVHLKRLNLSAEELVGTGWSALPTDGKTLLSWVSDQRLSPGLRRAAWKALASSMTPGDFSLATAKSLLDVQAPLSGSLDPAVRTAFEAEVNASRRTLASVAATAASFEGTLAGERDELLSFALACAPGSLAGIDGVPGINLAIHDLLASHGQTAANEDQLQQKISTLEERLSRKVDGPSAGAIRGLLESLNTLRSEQPDPAAPPSLDQLRSLGPGGLQPGWTVVAEPGNEVRYEGPQQGPQPGPSVTFIPIKLSLATPGGAPIRWIFLSKTEIPVGVFAAALGRQEPKELSNLKVYLDEKTRSKYIFGWRWDPRLGVVPSDAWYGTNRSLVPKDAAPGVQMPVQGVTTDLAKLVAMRLNCRLPTYDEWRIASSDPSAQAKRLVDNLRDKTWQAQAKRRAPRADEGSYAESLEPAPASNRDDDYFLFRRVDEGNKVQGFYDLIGNVAEIVKSQDGYGVVGGSAISDPGKVNAVVPMGPIFYSDVGFRIAFDGTAGVKSLSQRLRSIKLSYIEMPR